MIYTESQKNQTTMLEQKIISKTLKRQILLSKLLEESIDIAELQETFLNNDNRLWLKG